MFCKQTKTPSEEVLVVTPIERNERLVFNRCRQLQTSG